MQQEDTGVWSLVYTGFDPEQEKLREALTTVGNGYLCTRGALATQRQGDNHYPATYIAGLYNRMPSTVGDKTIYNNDLVNATNWHVMEIAFDSEEYISPFDMELLDYRQTLNMKCGTMEHRLICRDSRNRILQIIIRRFVSMASPHLLGQQCLITPLNFSEDIRVRLSLDADHINDNVERYSDLNQNHLRPVTMGEDGGTLHLRVRTSESDYHVSMWSHSAVYCGNEKLHPLRTVTELKAAISEELRIPMLENNTYQIDKLVTVFTSYDKGVQDPCVSARSALKKAHGYETEYQRHTAAWDDIWDRMDIEIVGDPFSQRIVRLHMFHLLCSALPVNTEIDAGIPARGLHGEGYRGHIFWDEIFTLPFYLHRFPEIARAHLLYRYRRLDDARKNAAEAGFSGAMYPWQTADTGREETQALHYNPKDGSWGPDYSRRQRHISIGIFYNIWEYLKHTNDKKFRHQFGAEMLIEIARFWASITCHNPKTGRCHIDGVMGPDEFHEKLPGSDKPGFSDNAYTNIMTVWLMDRALELVDTLPKSVLRKIMKKTGFDLQETEKWRVISTCMNVIINDDGIISQFDGYFSLPDIDWDAYREKYGDIHRMDRILKAEDDSPDNYKVTKQADVLMAYYMLGVDGVTEVLRQLGYTVKEPMEMLRKNYHYYEKRTSHGSTLSLICHAVVASYMHEDEIAQQWFQEALKSDIYDRQGGTTPEGIHLGVMAGTIAIITRDFAGVSLSGDSPELHPALPKQWEYLSIRLQHLGRRHLFEIGAPAGRR
ncbi:MAG: glycoside hydrolase family 65 protein [Spirochaeta sp.]